VEWPTDSSTCSAKQCAPHSPLDHDLNIPMGTLHALRLSASLLMTGLILVRRHRSKPPLSASLLRALTFASGCMLHYFGTIYHRTPSLLLSSVLSCVHDSWACRAGTGCAPVSGPLIAAISRAGPPFAVQSIGSPLFVQAGLRGFFRSRSKHHTLRSGCSLRGSFLEAPCEMYSESLRHLILTEHCSHVRAS
jgi:hypothetical protein